MNVRTKSGVNVMGGEEITCSENFLDVHLSRPFHDEGLKTKPPLTTTSEKKERKRHYRYLYFMMIEAARTNFNDPSQFIIKSTFIAQKRVFIINEEQQQNKFYK